MNVKAATPVALSLLTSILCFTAAIAQPAGAAESGDKKKWEVDNPPGPAKMVSVDVTSGTWMSLDVSPDGREIAFDLLGDIYTIPIGGGDATSITSGVSWDMQPTYSPDGTRIAFTSDRGGGNNIWAMDRDGTDPKAVTDESFRLLNSPAWAPDGSYVAARKHFTSSRSLGAGEIWLYHLTAGKSGLQMTKRPNDQKDVGEPSFSPDGRYLYFSQDTTPGSTFQYNKDSNTQIYTIRRLDRETGRLETFVSGAGGAVRPVPSPDGRYLAFVRRVRFQSTLFLRDLRSGNERAIYSNLERDMQEAWAIHGVYPAFDWTPDSQSIVLWAKGKIRRVQVGSGLASEIPFRVRSERKLYDAVRFPVEVHPGEFPTKMLRWVTVSPTGGEVVYQALGHLYTRSLPDGEPRRLTSQTDHFEFYPSFSRDGSQVVYVAWDDEQLSSIRVVSSSGGAGRVVTSVPGHYLEPVFSPDGSAIVYRKARGGRLTNPDWSMDPGLYMQSTRGGDPVLLSRSGSRPHFGADSDRVFFTARAGQGKTALFSMRLDDRSQMQHFSSTNAVEFRVSPDGEWLAFVERFKAYIVPFVWTGSTISLGPKTKSLPISQVASDAGEYLHWSGDSQRLHWSLGPELFSRDLNRSFSFIAGAEESPADPESSGVDISFRASSSVPTGKLAFVGGRLITMRRDEVIENGTVIVEGNRITAVGARNSVAIPSDAHVVDVSGQTLMPGLIDVHAHGGQGANEITPQQNWSHFSGLSFGVTTVHDPSNDTSTIFAASEMSRAGLITAPRIFSTGTILYGATTPFTAEVNNLDDALFHLRRMKAVGAFSVKSYNQPRREQRQQIIAAARELDMMVVPEGGSLFHNNMTMVADGHTGVEHSLPVANIYEDVLQFWGASKTGYTPTMVVGFGGLSGEFYWYHHNNVWENERLLTFVPRASVDARSRRRPMAPEEEYNHIDIARAAKHLIDRGVSVQIGAHGQREGLAAHWETWMLEQGGFTPLEALRSATLQGAQYLGMDGDLGSLEVGKLADFIVLEKNPLENIRDSETIKYTISNGRLFDARTMNELGNHPRDRAKFYWEK